MPICSSRDLRVASRYQNRLAWSSTMTKLRNMRVQRVGKARDEESYTSGLKITRDIQVIYGQFINYAICFSEIWNNQIAIISGGSPKPSRFVLTYSWEHCPGRKKPQRCRIADQRDSMTPSVQLVGIWKYYNQFLGFVFSTSNEMKITNETQPEI